MAITTYTFPSQQTPAGTLSFEIKTSEGAGGTVDVDSVYSYKYFSDDITVSNETEFLGGEIQSSYLDARIDYDKDSLFKNTIFDSFNTQGGWVSLKVSLGSNILFIGNIVQTTISIEPFYADNDALSGSKHSVGFRCVWILAMLREITGKALGEHIASNLSYYKPITTATPDLTGGSNLKFTTVTQILFGCIRLLNTNYGYSCTINIDDNGYVFFSKDSSVDFDNNLNANSQYIYPDVSGYGEIDYAGIVNSVGSIFDPSIGIILANGVGSLTGYFNEDDDKYISTAYEFFMGIMKSFNFYPSFTYSGSGINIVIGTRTSGSSVVISGVVSQTDKPFSELARSSVDISSAITGRSYEKDLKNPGGSEYSHQNLFDFHSTDLPGGELTNNINTEYSLMYPMDIKGGGYFFLIRDLIIGGNRVSNGSFDSDIDGWTVDSGTWEYSSVDIGFGAGTAKCTVSSGTSTSEIYTEFDDYIADYVLMSAWARLDYTSIDTRNENIKVYLNFYYNGTKVNIPEPESSRTDYKYLYIQESGVFSAIRNPALLTLPYRKPRGENAYRINGVGIEVVATNLGGTANIYFDRVFSGINRRGTPELVGAMIEDYFGTDLSRKEYVLNGLLLRAKTGDYFLVDGVKHYIKKIDYSIKNNETEIEAINYPY